MLRTDELEQTLRTIAATQYPELEKHHRSLVRTAERQLERHPLRNEQTALARFRLARLRDRFAESLRKDPTDRGHFYNADHHLEVFYLSNKLRHYAESAALARLHTQINPLELPAGLLERAATYTEPTVVAYYLVVTLFLYPEEETRFATFKAFLRESIHHFDHYEQQHLLVYAINYCIDTKINAGRADFFEELFQLYRDALGTGILLERDYLPPGHYKNIITVGMRAGQLQWTEAFIQTHTDRLPPEHRADAEAYNLAKLYFHRNDHDRVLEQLRAVTDRNDRYAFGSKILLLKTYFQLGEDRPLQSLLESFRLYVRRHPRLSAPVRRRYLSFLKIFKRLVRLNPYERAEWAQFRTAVVEEEGLLEREWFLGILEERAGSRE